MKATSIIDNYRGKLFVLFSATAQSLELYSVSNGILLNEIGLFLRLVHLEHKHHMITLTPGTANTTKINAIILEINESQK